MGEVGADMVVQDQWLVPSRGMCGVELFQRDEGQLVWSSYCPSREPWAFPCGSSGLEFRSGMLGDVWLLYLVPPVCLGPILHLPPKLPLP